MTRLLPRLLLLVAIVVASSTVAAQTKGADGNANIIRWAKGKIEYRVLSTGERNGEEDWYLTVHPDCSRTMRAVNRLDNVDCNRTLSLLVA